MHHTHNLLARCEQFWSRTVLHARRGETPIPWPAVRLLRTLSLAARGFSVRQGSMHASALTFYSLLSLVPLAAMAFGVAKGFGLEQVLERELMTHFAAQEEVVSKVIAFARNMLENTRGGLIAGVGVVVLFWSVIKVLGKIEDNFNLVWGVSARPLPRKMTDYLAIMIVAPLILVMSGSATVFIASQVRAISSQVGMGDMLDPAVSLGLAMAPYALLWVLFCLVYLIMPNTRVPLPGAVMAGFLAGSAYQALQATYIEFQINVTSYNAIYGSFAALPLFLVWLRLSWMIVLFGAETAHAFPLSESAGDDLDNPARSVGQTRLLALAVSQEVVRRFYLDAPPLAASDLARCLDLPRTATRDIAAMLVDADVLCRVESGTGEPLLLPARDSSRIALLDVIDAVDGADGNPDFPYHHPRLAALKSRLDAVRSEMGASARILLRDMEFPEGCPAAERNGRP
jgi:membrane protein